ncbi:MAG: class B sortase [Clostridium sp.]|nr:class B sortase [Clostridium sp.]
MSKKGTIKEVLRKIMFFISLIVFCVCSFKLYNIWKEYHDNSKSYDEVREFAPEKVEESNNDETPEKPKFVFEKEDYDSLLAMNSDFKAWIYIPNTEISYPVVQTDNNDYYLKHNFKKENNSGGAIFISSNNREPFVEKNTIMHGHHMRDGSMFASLMKFKEEDFAKGTPIYINTKDELLQYEVFSVFYETANNDSYQSGFTNDDQYLDYLNNLKGKSLFDLGKNLIKDDKIITLSTCDYDVDDGRLLVCARLVSMSNY